MCTYLVVEMGPWPSHPLAHFTRSKSKGSKQVDRQAGRHRMAWRGVIRRVHLFVFYIWKLSPPSGTLISMVLHTWSGPVLTEGHLFPEYYRHWHFVFATLSHRVSEAA